MKQVHTCLHILFLQIYQIFSTKPLNLSKQKPKQQNKTKIPTTKATDLLSILGVLDFSTCHWILY